MPKVIEKADLIRCEYAQRKSWPSTFRKGARVCVACDRLRCRFHQAAEEQRAIPLPAATHPVMAQRVPQEPRRLAGIGFKNPMLAPQELTTREVLRQFPSSSLRPYQKETIERIVDAFKSGKKCVVLTAPAGFG